MARYEGGMIQHTAMPNEGPADALQEALAQGDIMLRSVPSIMRQLIVGPKHTAFSDEIVARVRGSVFDVAQQLLNAGARPDGYEPTVLDQLSASLAGIPSFLSHVHGLALEWQLTDRLRAELTLDPALPAFFQALLASNDVATSALAMNIVAAQARFVQMQRRMQLPLNELPADLLHTALSALRTLGARDTTAAEEMIRAKYDESRTRLALLARAVTGLESGTSTALSLSHAGVAMFATTLGLATGIDREVVLLSTLEEQSLRLALILRAAGLDEQKINEQLLVLHPQSVYPGSWGGISPKLAKTILARSAPSAGK